MPMKTHAFRFGLIVLLVAGLAVMAACGGSNNSNSSSGNESGGKSSDKPAEAVKIVIPEYHVGQYVGAEYVAEKVRLFNEKFAGKYEVILEDVPGPDEYIEKLKVLNAADKLPPLFEMGRDPSLAEIVIRNNKVVDLMPYMTDEWKNNVLEHSLEYNTVDGKLVGAPNRVDRFVGIFYNKEIFANAGIKEFPKTWEEFFEVCELLKSKGVTPLALHTTGTGWVPNLFLTAMAAGGSEEGLKFFQTKFPTDFEQPFMIDAFAQMQRLFEYGTAEAVGGSYAMAANLFVNSQAAMIANGPWMLTTFLDPKSSPEGFVDKVGYAMFPGDAVISFEAGRYGWAVAANQPKEVIEGSIEFLKFEASDEIIRLEMLAYGSASPKVELTDAQKAEQPKLTLEMNEILKDAKKILPNFQSSWDTAVQNDGITKEMPLLATKNITPEEYAKRLSETARKFQESAAATK